MMNRNYIALECYLAILANPYMQKVLHEKKARQCKNYRAHDHNATVAFQAADAFLAEAAKGNEAGK